eukprot:Selendium_serpulae@DN5069_c0_g1_i2.p2
MNSDLGDFDFSGAMDPPDTSYQASDPFGSMGFQGASPEPLKQGSMDSNSLVMETGSPKSMSPTIEPSPALESPGSPEKLVDSRRASLDSGKSITKTKLREWEEKHEVELEQKAKAEDSERTRLRKLAVEQVAKWESERQAAIEKTRKANRMEEKVALQAKQDSFDKSNRADGISWERVYQLIDFNKEPSAGQRDTSRMKQLLFQMRQSQQTAT